MRFSTFITGAAVVALFGFLAFRIIDLEQRVAALSDQIGLPASRDPDLPQEKLAASGSPQGYEQRIAALEQHCKALSTAGNAPARPSAGDTNGNVREHEEEAILSVMERENNRLRDVQLEWSRSRWLEGRETQLTLFASALKLDPKQTDALHKTLEHEVDRMVEVLKRPRLLEDPDQMSADWQAVLDETDKSATEVLTPDQRVWWSAARNSERKTFWPWLPQATAQK